MSGTRRDSTPTECFCAARRNVNTHSSLEAKNASASIPSAPNVAVRLRNCIFADAVCSRFPLILADSVCQQKTVRTICEVGSAIATGIVSRPPDLKEGPAVRSELRASSPEPIFPRPHGFRVVGPDETTDAPTAPAQDRSHAAKDKPIVKPAGEHSHCRCWLLSSSRRAAFLGTGLSRGGQRPSHRADRSPSLRIRQARQSRSMEFREARRRSAWR